MDKIGTFGGERGGPRPGQKDSAPRKTGARKLAALAVSQVIQPLDVLLTTMRRAWHRAEELRLYHLHVRHEAEVLAQVSSLTDLLAPWKDDELGRTFVVKPPTMIEPEDLRTRIRGQAGGHPVPDWAHGGVGRLDRGLSIHRVRNAIHAPIYGAVIARDGSVLHQSVEEALYGTPTLAALPNVMMVDGQPIMAVPRDIVNFDRGTVFCAAGGLLNYGHFILDCMTALLAIEQIGLTEDYSPLMPGFLKEWHYDLLDRMNPKGRLVDISQPLVRVNDLLYASPMAHYLAYPGELLYDLRMRLAKDTAVSNRRIYFSRLGDKKREMVNEAMLETALHERGFVIIKPETLSVHRQIELMSQTSILAGAVGAAFANCLFMPHGSRIIEIQPSNYLQSFVRAMCDVLSMEWYPFFCQSPLEERRLLIEGEERHGPFSFQIKLDEFLSFLDKVAPRS